MSNASLLSSARWGVAMVAVAMMLGACKKPEPAPSPSPVPEPKSTSLITESVTSPDRFAGDNEEDLWRQPQAVLEFMGVEPGMNVLDYFAASGYYSELLARSVGPQGSVIVYNNPPYAGFAGEKLTKRFADNRLPNAKVVTVPTAELKLEPNSLDGVLFVMSYHDLYWTPKDAKEPLGDPKQVTASLFTALKPGGVVVVVDHAAKAGGDIAKVADALHRIDAEVVKNDFAQAGFKFDGESMALQHPDDDRSKLVFDESIRHKTDQFIFSFSKPTSPSNP